MVKKKLFFQKKKEIQSKINVINVGMFNNRKRIFFKRLIFSNWNGQTFKLLAFKGISKTIIIISAIIIIPTPIPIFFKTFIVNLFFSFFSRFINIQIFIRIIIQNLQNVNNIKRSRSRDAENKINYNLNLTKKWGLG